MQTVSGVLATFARHFPGAGSTVQSELFARSYKRLLDLAELRTTDVNLTSFVAGTREYAWAEADLMCYGVTWYLSQTSWRSLLPTSEANLRDVNPSWKDETQKQAALTVTAATAASPTVLSVTHGLSSTNDGTITNQVYVHSIGGVTDGWYFAKITGYSAGTLGLYSDISLANPVSSTGVLGSSPAISLLGPEIGTPTQFYVRSELDTTSNRTGKLLIGFDPAPNATTTNGYPRAVLHCQEHAAITGSTQLPYSLLDELAIVYAMNWMYCAEWDVNQVAFWEKKMIAEDAKQVAHLRNLLPDVPTMFVPTRRAGPGSTRIVI